MKTSSGRPRSGKSSGHLPSKKAPAKKPKPRPLSKGLRKRAGGNHGNGRKFQPGQNSHSNEVFRRGPDMIPRGNIPLMYRVVLNDGREDLYKSLRKACRSPSGAMRFLEQAADRLEGRPLVKKEIQRTRRTEFVFADGTPALPPDPGRPSQAVLSPADEAIILGPEGEVLLKVGGR